MTLSTLVGKTNSVCMTCDRLKNIRIALVERQWTNQSPSHQTHLTYLTKWQMRRKNHGNLVVGNSSSNINLVPWMRFVVSYTLKHSN